MQVQTILNFVEPVKSFVYRRVSWAAEASRPTLRVEVEHRKNSRPICSGCHKGKAEGDSQLRAWGPEGPALDEEGPSDGHIQYLR